MQTAEQQLDHFLIETHLTYGPHRNAWPAEVRDEEQRLMHAAWNERRAQGRF